MLTKEEKEKVELHKQMKAYVESLRTSEEDELGIWEPEGTIFKNSKVKIYEPIYIKSPLEFAEEINGMKIGDIKDVIGWHYSKLRLLVVVDKLAGKVYYLQRVAEFSHNNMPMKKIVELPLLKGIIETSKFREKMQIVNCFSSIVKIYARKTETNEGSLIYES